MSLIRSILILVVSLVIHFTCLSQAQLGQVQGYVGTSIFPAEDNQALMTGYTPGITIGAGVSKTITPALIFNPNIEFTATTKDHFSFSLVSLHNNVKYYPFIQGKVRPYLMGIVNISFINLHQEAYQTDAAPDPSYSVSGPANVPVERITYREPDLKVSFAPTLGVGAGIGVDIPVRLKIVPFIQYSFTAYLSESSGLINRAFSTNTTGLSTQNIVVGVRYNLYKSVKK